MAALSAGIRTLDSSIGGLGGCPYSPGATGNVATEDILYALRDSPYSASGNLDALVDVGFWVSAKLGRDNSSRVAKALRARRERDRQTQPGAKL
jgi:hydroxymethylglutaryl-CoA lyase